MAGRAPLCWAEAVAAAAGAAWFFLLGGARALPPSRLDWVGRGDLSQHVLGWLFFRRSRWALPLGRVDGFAWPAGTTVGFTDANPLLALPAKALSPLLPLDFQYVGGWLLACFVLQGFFGARLAARGSPRPLHRALGGALLAMSPPLTARIGHDTLCAHFALLALLALHFAPAFDAAGARRALRTAWLVTLLLGAVHPYLAVMALALSAALALRVAEVDRVIPRRAAALAALLLALSLAAVFALLGYLTSAPSHGPGFGRYGADLLTFVNPDGASWLLPPLPVHWGAWEGNAYLGLGGMAVVAAAGALALRRRTLSGLRPAAPLLAVGLVLAVLSLADVVRAGGLEVVSLRGLYRPLAGVVGPFRSSGRFVWPLYYALLGGAVVAVPRLARRPALATAALAGAVALQVADLAPPALGARFREAPWRFHDARWELARGRYLHLALAPALIVGGGPPCAGPGWDEEAWQAPAYEAYRLGLTVNSGFVARGAHEKFEGPCREVERQAVDGQLSPGTIYVVQPARAAALAGRPGLRCGVLDGRHVCVSDAPGDPFAAAL